MIGILDSGVGGLGVLREVRVLLPDRDILYLADQANAPYGEKTIDEVGAITRRAVDWLLSQGAVSITIACNTASAACLHELRNERPGIPFIGMEPAVKPASALTQTGVIGVLATSVTFQGTLYASLVDRYGSEHQIVTRACPEWVRLVEAGDLTSTDAESAVKACVQPLLDQGADVLVLGCTHFPFLRPLIAKVVGPGVSIIDPAPSVAARVVEMSPPRPGETGRTVIATTADPAKLSRLISHLGGFEPSEIVLAWDLDDSPLPA